MSKDVRFASYMREIDAEISRRVGLTSSDLTDYGYRDAFNDEIPPEEVALEVLADNGFDGAA